MPSKFIEMRWFTLPYMFIKVESYKTIYENAVCSPVVVNQFKNKNFTSLDNACNLLASMRRTSSYVASHGVFIKLVNL